MLCPGCGIRGIESHRWRLAVQSISTWVQRDGFGIRGLTTTHLVAFAELGLSPGARKPRHKDTMNGGSSPTSEAVVRTLSNHTRKDAVRRLIGRGERCIRCSVAGERARREACMMYGPPHTHKKRLYTRHCFRYSRHRGIALQTFERKILYSLEKGRGAS